MTKASFISNSIPKKFSTRLIKTFFIISFLFSGLFLSYAQLEDVNSNLENGVDITGTTGLPTSPVTDGDTSVTNNTECGGSDNFNCYTLLEGFGGDGEEGKLNTVTIREGGLGYYLEQIMTYFLMIVTIAAVFFMIYGGVLYLTTDIVNKKAEGKEVITRVIVGLIFVFSVWTIMNSINSGLLKNSLDFSLKGIAASVASAVTGVPKPASPATIPPGTPTTIPASASCSSENITTVYGIKVCNTVASNLKNMIDRAKSEGITLTQTGLLSGIRTLENQEELRAKNCGGAGNIYNKNARCVPLTALPGQSNHQSGQAIDFAEAGNSKGGRGSAAYGWLDKNAASFGFYNKIISEPWHWSVTGK